MSFQKGQQCIWTKLKFFPLSKSRRKRSEILHSVSKIVKLDFQEKKIKAVNNSEKLNFEIFGHPKKIFLEF